MRVLLTHVVLGRGGDAIQWMSLAEAFRLQGHDVAFAGANAIAPYGVDSAGARLRTFARRLPWWIRDTLEIGLTALALARAWRAGRRCGVELIVHRAATYEFMAPLLAHLMGVPVIAYLDTHVPAERRYRSESYWRWLHERTMAWLGHMATLLVTPSEVLRLHYCQMGLPADKLVVRRNGIFERHLRLGEEAACAWPPMARGSECVVGFVGSLSDWHRVDVLLDAVAALVHEGGSVSYRLTIVGTGRQDALLRSRAAHAGIAHLVEWRGPLPHDRAVATMREFDIAVLPSTLPTGAPMKLAEYAAMARPIVAPALPNIRDLLVPDVEAVLVEPDNAAALARAIAALASDVERARRIGCAAQARVREWTWEGTVEALTAACAPAGATTPRPGTAPDEASGATGSSRPMAETPPSALP